MYMVTKVRAWLRDENSILLELLASRTFIYLMRRYNFACRSSLCGTVHQRFFWAGSTTLLLLTYGQ